MRRHALRLFLIAVLGLLLNGCSAIRLGYGNADSLARWWIDQYIDMSPEQDALARERLSRLHAWHRKTQLPDYAALLRDGKKFVGGQPTAADALALGDGIVRRGRTLADQAIPDLADFLATVTPAQIDLMATRMAEKNADYAKEMQLDGGDLAQRKARYKRTLERAEYWFGDLGDAQKDGLRRMIEGQVAEARFLYDERLRRQREWLDLARQAQRDRPPRERLAQWLRDYASRFDQPGDPARLAKTAALRRASAELTVAIHAMTTPAQRAHAAQKLDDLIRELTELSQES